MPIRGVDFVMYNTKDIRKTRAFYQRLFGLKRGEEWNDWWSELHTEPLTVCLNGTPESSRRDWDWSGPACVAFAVDDVRAAIAACRRRKVKVLIEPVETRVCWMAWIADRMGIASACIHARTARPVDRLRVLAIALLDRRIEAAISTRRPGWTTLHAPRL